MLFSKMYDELSVDELYEILKSRSEVFLLEQRIICQDMDDEEEDYEKNTVFVIGYYSSFADTIGKRKRNSISYAL